MSSSMARRGDPLPQEPTASTLAVSQLARVQSPPVDRLEAEALAEMVAAWRSGARTGAEQWLERHPEIGQDPSKAARLIYEEICLRQAQGETVESTEIYRRFPQWQGELAVLLDCHRLLESGRAPGAFPEAGEQFGEFQLLSELGRGAVGRVFLATQPALSDRPLVVKLTPRSGDEHLSLARLQHTHIVPLYLVQDFPDEDLRALCMPYLGGFSWSFALQSLKGRPPADRTGRKLAELLATAAASAPIAMNSAGPALHFLQRANYVQVVCWIGACLADALQYAHQRGLVHLDIKPSNVLLAGDGQPMLLDFHLARAMVPAGGGPIDHLGGTRGYMAPEQELAAVAVRQGLPIEVALNGSADIFALGVLLYESLVGRLPAAPEAVSRRDMRRLNPQVSRSIEDLVHKCLAREPAARCRDAGELASDLRRHLADLPLRCVANRSLRERWQKWRRRKPHAILLLAVVLLGLIGTGALGLLVSGDRLQEARAALARGQSQLDHQSYDAAVEELEAGWNAVRWMPGQNDLQQALQAKLELAKRARLAHALSTLVEKLRFVDILDSVPAAQLQGLEAGCRKVWQARRQILQLDASKSASEIQRHLRTDLLDLALLWADLTVRLAPVRQTAQARSDALRLLDEAETLCGPSAALELARSDYSTTDGSRTHALDPVVKPRTVWEHCAVGRWLLRGGRLPEAEQEFQRAIDLEPSAFWPNFYQMLCTYRQGRYAEALNAGYACVALAPISAECFYNRALAHQALGHVEPALADFARAIELEPALTVAALRCGMLLCEQQRFAEATATIKSIRAHLDPAAAVDCQQAVDQMAQRDRNAALASLRRALERD